jgi:hypothetical protein
MNDENPAIYATMMLLRVANIISPLHAKAVSEHLLASGHVACTCNDCADRIAECIQAIVTIMDDIAVAADRNGEAVALAPVSQEDIANRDELLSRELHQLMIYNAQFMVKP